MNVLLVRPHLYLKIAEKFLGFVRLEPLDLALVAAGVDRTHDVRILDLAIERGPVRRFQREIAAFSPDIIGFGGYSNQAIHVKALARIAREALPDCLIVVGGVHATIVPQDMKMPGIIDVVVRGDGVSAMEAISRQWNTDRTLPEQPGILPVKSETFEEQAALPPPALDKRCITTLPRRDLLNPARYYSPAGIAGRKRLPSLFPPMASMRTSVGCPHRCSFCVVHYLANGKYLQREPAEVVDEIAALKQDYVYFVDDEMFINPRRAMEIAELIRERGIEKRYVSWARADTICENPEMFRLWREIGLETLYVGLESLEEAHLENYNKGLAPDTNRKAVEILRELDIGLHAAFIVHPDFTKDDFLALRKSIDFVAPAETTFTVFSPSPGTALFDEHRENFICENPYLFYDCMHTLMPAQLPLKTFYRYFALLYLFAFRKNPWRANKIKVPLRDFLRMVSRGAACGMALRAIYKDYDRSLW